MLEKKIESVDKEQERIFAELISSTQIKQKYVVKSEYELVKNLVKIFKNIGVQTDPIQFGTTFKCKHSSVTSSSNSEENSITFDPQDRTVSINLPKSKMISIKDEEAPVMPVFNFDKPQIAQDPKQLIKSELLYKVDEQSKNYKILSKEKLFNVVDEIIMSKLTQIFDSQQAWRGQIGQSESTTPENKQTRVVIQSTSLIEYAYKYYLKQFGLKSTVI